MNLYKSLINKEYLITKINLNYNNQRKLYDIGLIPGTIIKKTYKNIFNNSFTYEYKNTFITIKNNISKNIEVCLNE